MTEDLLHWRSDPPTRKAIYRVRSEDGKQSGYRRWDGSNWGRLWKTRKQASADHGLWPGTGPSKPVLWALEGRTRPPVSGFDAIVLEKSPGGYVITFKLHGRVVSRRPAPEWSESTEGVELSGLGGTVFLRK